MQHTNTRYGPNSPCLNVNTACKFTLEHAMKAQKGSRDIALLFI